MQEIASKFKSCAQSIIRINIGETYFSEKETYPLRDKGFNKRRIKFGQLEELIDNLKNTKISLTELSKIYGIHQSQIGRINKGLAYHNATIQYPIRIIKYKRKSS
jgi:hypothetical protein